MRGRGEYRDMFYNKEKLHSALSCKTSGGVYYEGRWLWKR